MAQGKWDQTSTEGTQLWSADFPSALLTTTYTQNIAKVAGFVGMRARVRVRIQFNSQPFQQGMAILSFMPYAEYMPRHAAWFYKGLSGNLADMCAVSALPHVLLNLANQTAMEFVTPYVSPYLYVNLVTGQGSFGRVVLNSLSPVLSQANSTVNFTVWANFEDVELIWPTDAPLATAWAQVGSELPTMEKTGAISNTITSIGSAASSILPMVGLGSLAKPVSLFSTAASNVLKLFGFSKPTVQAPVTRVLQAPGRYFLNYDGADTSHKLGFSAGNELQTFSGFAGTDHDEMALSYIAARPAYIANFDWNVADQSDTALWSLPLSPQYLGWKGAASTVVKGSVDRLSPAARIATLLNLWRGDFVFDFHFVKTQMHSGRVRISSRLYNYATQSFPLNDMPGYTETADVDLTTSSTVRFRIPFAAVRPWLLTEIDRGVPLTSGDARNYCLGQIQMTVINPLVAAPQCASVVEVIVFSHMENAQFAVPNQTTFLPYGLPTTALASSSTLEVVPTNKGKKPPKRSKREVVEDMDNEIPVEGTAQVGGVEDTKEVSEDHMNAGGLKIPPASMCVGEVVTSARQLIKRFIRVQTSTFTAIPANATQPGTTATNLLIRPWQLTPVATGSITSTTPLYTPTDYIQHLAPMYSFMRGSVRFKLALITIPANFNASIPFSVYINNSTINRTASNPGSAIGSGIMASIVDIPVASPGNLAYQPGFGDNPLVIYLDKEGIIEFEVPYYSTGHMVATFYGSTTLADSRISKIPIPTVVVSHPQIAGATLSLYRAAGDDFSFGGLLGVPQVMEYQYATNPTT